MSCDPLEGFCIRCRQTKTMVGILLTTLGNGTPAVRGACPDCGTQMYKLLPKRAPEEQRRSVRVACEVMLKFRRLRTNGVSGEEQEYHEGRAGNLSQAGMMVEASCPLKEGQLLDIYAATDNPVTASVGIAKVMWHEEENGKHRVGISFILKQDL